MAVKWQHCGGGVVVAKFSHQGRRCYLLRMPGDERLEGVFAPAEDVAGGSLPLEELTPGAWATAATLFHRALYRARRVIEAGEAERQAFQRTAELQGLELDALADQATAYGNAAAEFHRLHGKGRPLVEELSR